MDPLKPRRTRTRGPEAAIQIPLKAKLESLGWLVIVTHGNEYQMGLPDLYCCHSTYGTRWIEVKNPKAYAFTAAQHEVFHAMAAKGVGIWVLVGTGDEEIRKLHGPPNWYMYLSIMKV